MFFTFALSLFLLGTSILGVPLENPSDNVSKYFNPRLVGGTQAPPGAAPHAVALVVGIQFPALVCGGSIITRTCILTAAHCIVPYIGRTGNLLGTFHTVVGTNNWILGGTKINFAGYELHPDYDYETLDHDVGILILNQLLQFSETVQPIVLEYDIVQHNEESIVYGWGTTRLGGIVPWELNQLEVKSVDVELCRERINAVYETTGASGPTVHPQLEVCTLHSAGHGMCHGDSGSAVIVVKSGRQYGVVSWGMACATGVPDVHASVRGLRDFIDSVIEQNF